MKDYNDQIKQIANDRLTSIGGYLEAEALFYSGDIFDGLNNPFRKILEDLKSSEPQHDRIVIILSTPGGSVEEVETLVEIIRHHYSEVYFLVPAQAMSAGTVFALSGDRLYMDYASALGPIDPQVYDKTKGEWVPALGHLDKVNEMVEKSRAGTITAIEAQILLNQNLASLSRYEQAKELSVTLLKKWLVENKFKDWTVHRTNKKKKGSPVSVKEKQERADHIARDLSNNQLWHSHGRRISPQTLKSVLRLEIEDYSTDKDLSARVNAYIQFISKHIEINAQPRTIHTRLFL